MLLRVEMYWSQLQPDALFLPREFQAVFSHNIPVHAPELLMNFFQIKTCSLLYRISSFFLSEDDCHGVILISSI